MNLRTRIFFRFFGLLHCISFLCAKSRRDFKMPDYYKVVEKNDFLQQKSNAILNHFNISVNVEGFENVPNGPCLIIPNHSTYLDPLIMWSALWNHRDGSKQSKLVNFVARKEIAKKKMVKRIADLGQTYYIDTQNPREALATLKDFGQFIKRNKSCGVIFAEGTRTKDGKLGEFHSGAFKLAQSSYLTIVPATINNAANALDWNRKEKLEVKVTFHKPMKPIQFQSLDSRVLAEQVKSIVASDYIDQTITSNETIKNKYSKRDKVKEVKR